MRILIGVLIAIGLLEHRYGLRYELLKHKIALVVNAMNRHRYVTATFCQISRCAAYYVLETTIAVALKLI